ncbi:MAG TPA: cytochrome c [Allosphingosinicella sp.]|jgi:mono/diheme cytochrome c family protein|nr:cytochrome c [Allosphingosinicella sp.]
MRRPSLASFCLGFALIAFAAAAAAPPAPPDNGADPGGGAVPVPPAGNDDVTADVATWGPPSAAEPAGAADAHSADPAVRGRYLVDAGDCKSCHTAVGGQPFAGARPIPTPFGQVFSANLTPDAATGIGAWTADHFYRAMHKGRGPHGKHFYPVFPYTHFTQMPRADTDAIYAYLRTLPPVVLKTPPPKIPFPLNIRGLLGIWNALFFHPGEFRPAPAKSEEWNRGAYLVQGPGHCGGCHTPKNFLGADKRKRLYQGGKLDNWVAVNLTEDPRQGLARWSREDVAEYLRAGRNGWSTASGPMQEVIYYSTSRMSDADLLAIATYLKDLPPAAPAVHATPPGAAQMQAGAAIFADTCAGCHKANGEGNPGLFPPLAGNASVQSKDPTTLVRIVLQGSRSVPTPAKPTPLAMPAFAWKLGDGEIAAVTTFIRNSWGNEAPAVGPGKVAKLRRKYSSRS